jgi:hypothetical protein
LVRAFLEVIAGHGPTVTPHQRTDIQHTDGATIKISLVMARELLHAVAKIEQPEVSGADVSATRAEE